MWQLKHNFTKGCRSAPVNVMTEMCGLFSTSTLSPVSVCPVSRDVLASRNFSQPGSGSSRFRDATSRCSSCGRNSVKTPGDGPDSAELFFYCFALFLERIPGESLRVKMRRFCAIWLNWRRPDHVSDDFPFADVRFF